MKKRSVSLLLVLCLMFSICSLCFVGTASAKTVNSYSSLVSLTFDGKEPYGIPFHRKVSSVSYENDTVVFRKAKNNVGTAWIGKDGSVGASPVTQAADATLVAEAKENLFFCEAGKTYRLKFDYKFLAGTGGTSAAIDVRLHPDPTPSSITASDLNLSEHATLVDSQAAKITFGETATVLEQDTDWQTAYYIFTINEDETDGVAVGFRPGYNTNYNVNSAIDNLTIEVVTSFEYNESRLHTMDDTVNDAFITASGCNDGTALVENYDEEHGGVLKLVGGSNARLGFGDFDVKENRKYYIYYDAKAETADAQPVTVIGANGSTTSKCRFFFTGYNNRNDGIQYFIDGEKVTVDNFKFSTEWQRYGIIIDTSNATMQEQILIYKSSGNFWTDWEIHFLFGVSSATAYFDNIQVIEVESIPEAIPDENDASAAASIRTAKSADENNGVYLSAGLRFRGIIDNDVKDNADEIGFLVAPSTSVKADTDWYDLENGLNPIVQQGICYKKDVTDIVYERGTYKTAYQMILTGLSTEDGKTAYTRRFTAVMYVKTGDTYTYYALGETSFNQVAATYRVMNIDIDTPSTGAGLVTISDEWKSHPQDYKLIAFTFDDGPTSVDGSDLSNNQNKIINTLNKYAGAGTLFVIGTRVQKYGVGQLEYAVENGFEIASHTMNHITINSDFLAENPNYTAQTYIDEEITQLNDLIKQEMDYDIKYLRAASGVIPDLVLEAAIQTNMPLVRGNIDINGNTVYISDYNDDTTPESIYEKVVSTAYDGKVVTMHGTSEQSAEILDDICATLYADGYRFVTVSELLEYKLKVTDPTQIDIENSYNEELYINDGLPRAIYRTSDVKLKYYNEDQWFLHPEDYKLIAFTFDDGPNASEVSNDNAVTRIIDLFGDYHGAGTFFFTGTSLEKYGTVIPKYALSKGHELANHSYSHQSLSSIITEKDATIDEVKKVNDWYKDNLDYTCKWFRGPGHSSNDYLWEYLTSIGMPAISAKTYRSSDFAGGSDTAEAIIERYTSTEIPHGTVILNHSTSSSTMMTPDALEVVLPTLYEKGYRFCTMSQLFELQGIDYEDIPTDKHISRVYVENGEPVYEYVD